MKILHISTSYPPHSNSAVDRQCRLIVSELGNRGHFNRVLTGEAGSAMASDRESAALRHLRPEQSENGVSFRRLLMLERRNMQALREELDQVYPDVVIVWNLSGLSNTLVWELQRRNLRTTFAIFDNWPRRRERDDPWFRWWSIPLPMRQRVVRRTLCSTGIRRLLSEGHPIRRPTEMCLKRAFFASSTLRESVRRGGFTVEGSEIVPYCVGRDEFPPQQARRDDPRRLLWIGPLSSESDPMTAIQAIQELRHNGEMRFSLDLFGRGDVVFESRLHDYVRSSQLAGAVTVRHASVEEVTQLFSTYDIFLFTSRNPGPFPVVLLRAMAARLPVVTTIEGSSADVVRANENAFVAATGDPVDFARKIFEVTNERERVEQMVARAYREVLDNYSAIAVAGRIERFITDAIREEYYY